MYITTVKCTVTLLYIDDIAEAIVRLQAVIPQADPSWTVEQDRRRPVPHRIMFIISAITRLLN